MHNQAQCPDGIGGIWYDKLWHKPELDSGHCSRELHHQQLHRIAERNIDWNCNRHLVRRERSCGIDRLQLYGGSDGRYRHLTSKRRCECDDARKRRWRLVRHGMERHCGLHPGHDGEPEW
jgi:hypothetical protein